MSDTAEQDRIERDLERTRARMDERLDELQNRLSPGQILDDLMAYFRGSEGADFARNLMTNVQANPMPAALTGIGLTWLMLSSQRPNTTAPATPLIMSERDELELRMKKAEQETVRYSGETTERYRDRVEDARAQVLGLQRQAEETADTFAQRIRDALGAAAASVNRTIQDAGDRVGSVAGQIGASVSGTGTQVAEGTRSARDMGGNLMATMAENPVVLGAVGLALGAVLGALVPQSEREEAALSRVADQARDAAKDLAQTAVDRGGQVAHDVLDAGRESASAHGLTGETTVAAIAQGIASGDLARNVRTVVNKALEAGADAVRGDPASGRSSRSDEAAGTG